MASRNSSVSFVKYPMISEESAVEEGDYSAQELSVPMLQLSVLMLELSVPVLQLSVPVLESRNSSVNFVKCPLVCEESAVEDGDYSAQ